MVGEHKNKTTYKIKLTETLNSKTVEKSFSFLSCYCTKALENPLSIKTFENVKKIVSIPMTP